MVRNWHHYYTYRVVGRGRRTSCCRWRVSSTSTRRRTDLSRWYSPSSCDLYSPESSWNVCTTTHNHCRLHALWLHCLGAQRSGVPALLGPNLQNSARFITRLSQVYRKIDLRHWLKTCWHFSQEYRKLIYEHYLRRYYGFIRGLKPYFSANPFFSFSGLTTWIPQTVYCYLWTCPYLLFSFFLFYTF